MNKIDPKIIRCKLHVSEEITDITLLPSDMYRIYAQLDMLSEDIVHELYFSDIMTGQMVSVKKSIDNRNIADSSRILLSSLSLGCIKRLIAQCHLNPFDAEWLHYDLDAYTSQGTELVLCIHL